jgi:hypothetical protein
VAPQSALREVNMPNLEDDRESMYAMGRHPGRFYVSGRFPQGGADHAAETAPGVELPICRFAYQVVDEEGEIIFERDQGWEIIERLAGWTRVGRLPPRSMSTLW